jgi:predicted MFS family arabinose efflux permease
MNPSGRASLLVLGMGALFVSADARIIDPLLKVVAGEFDVSTGAAAWTVTAYALPYGLCQLFYGPLGDRHGKLRVMSGALLLFALGTAACALVPSLAAFVLLRFLTGVAAAAVIPLSLSYIGDKVAYEDRQAALGRFMSALMLGQVLSSSLGGFFGQHLGWRGVFWLFGGLSCLATALFFVEARRFPEEKKPDRSLSLAPFGALVARLDARRVLLAVFLEGCLVFGGLAYLATSMKDRFPRFGYDGIGVMLAGFGVGGLFYATRVKKLVPRLGERGILTLGAALIGVGYALLALLPAWWLFPLAVLLFGMGYYTMHGSLQTRATELDPNARATAVSLFAFAFFLGQAIGPALMGKAIASFGYLPAFGGAALCVGLLAHWGRTWLKPASRR